MILFPRNPACVELFKDVSVLYNDIKMLIVLALSKLTCYQSRVISV